MKISRFWQVFMQVYTWWFLHCMNVHLYHRLLVLKWRQDMVRSGPNFLVSAGENVVQKQCRLCKLFLFSLFMWPVCASTSNGITVTVCIISYVTKCGTLQEQSPKEYELNYTVNKIAAALDTCPDLSGFLSRASWIFIHEIQIELD